MQIKGTAVKSIKDFVEKNHANDYILWLNTLSEPSRKIFTTPINIADWYSIEYGAIEPINVLGDLFYNGERLKLAYETGRFGAQTALTGVYKAFVMIASPNFIIERASRIMTSYYNPGNIVVKEKSQKNCVLHIDELAGNSPLIEMRIAGWISRAMELASCKNVTVDVTKSLTKKDPYTEIIIQWQ